MSIKDKLMGKSIRLVDYGSVEWLININYVEIQTQILALGCEKAIVLNDYNEIKQYKRLLRSIANTENYIDFDTEEKALEDLINMCEGIYIHKINESLRDRRLG